MQLAILYFIAQVLLPNTFQENKAVQKKTENIFLESCTITSKNYFLWLANNLKIYLVKLSLSYQ